jgi:hypothetical protein
MTADKQPVAEATPRTDAESFYGKYIEKSCPVVTKKFAQKLERELADAQAQLPDGMKDCSIVFKECAKGHGWLTATNWVQHECQKCQIDAAQAALKEANEKIASFCMDYRMKCDAETKTLHTKLSRFTEPRGGLVDELLALCNCGDGERCARCRAADALRGAEARKASAWNEAIEAAAQICDWWHSCKTSVTACKIRALRRSD